MIRFSAPAKIHLLGEHAVVYGKPAIISATNLRLTLTLKQSAAKTKQTKGVQKIQKAIERAITKKYKVKIPPYQIEIDSQFPLGSGLGGSAAISATLTGALLKLLKVKADLKEIYEIALQGERAIHGNPSGSDLAAVTYGGTLWFRKETPELKVFSQITLTSPVALMLLDSGKPEESTGEMIAKVAKLNASLKRNIFDQLELLAKSLATDSRDIKQIFKEANNWLVKLGVVSKNTQKLISLIEKSGGAAKITGAGGWKRGSGMILALGPQTEGREPHGTVYHPNSEKLEAFKPIKIKLNQEGLRAEK